MSEIRGTNFKKAFLVFTLIVVVSFISSPPGSSVEIAAWVQAFGSIGALWVAIWLFYAQAKDQRRREIRLRNEKELYVLDALLLEIGFIYINHTGGINKVFERIEGDILKKIDIYELEDPSKVYKSLGINMSLISDRSLAIDIIDFYNNFNLFVLAVKRHNDVIETVSMGKMVEYVEASEAGNYDEIGISTKYLRRLSKGVIEKYNELDRKIEIQKKMISI